MAAGDKTFFSDYPTSAWWEEDHNGCHIWHGARNNRGYARVRVKDKDWLLHRYRYLHEVGEIPDGMVLDHYVCSNGMGGCCNPHHCRPVTPRENVLRSDGPSAACAAQTHCKMGHPLSGDNLHPTYLAKGCRRCATCLRAWRRTHDKRRRAVTR